MASFDDLGRALRDDAEASAPRASAIDVDAVIRAARARRRPRQWAVGTLSVVAVLGLGGIAVGAVSDTPTLITAVDSPESDSAAPLETGLREGYGSTLRPAPSITCGDPAPTLTGPVNGLEARVALGGQNTLASTTVSVTLVNTSSEPLLVEIDGAPTVAVSTDGIVVGWGAATATQPSNALFPLEPGEARLVAIVTDLYACDADTASGSEPSERSEALPPGDYRVSGGITLVTPGGELGGLWSPPVALAIE